MSHPRSIRSWILVSVFGASLLLQLAAGCTGRGKAPPPAKEAVPAPPVKEAEVKAPVPVPAPAPPKTPEKAPEAPPPPITPAGLIQTLDKMTDGAAGLLREEYLQVVQKSLGSALPAESFVFALTLHDEDVLVGAFLSVEPLEPEPGTKAPPQKVRTFWLPRPKDPAQDPLRLTEVEMKPELGSSATLEKHASFPQVPFFLVRGERPEPPDPDAYSDVKWIEIWSLRPEGPRRIRQMEEHLFAPAGTSRTQTVKVLWIGEEDGPYYLAARQYRVSATPRNSARVDDDDGELIHRCEGSTTIYQLDAKGQASVLTAKQVAALRKTSLELTQFPLDGKGTTEDACAELE